MDFQSCPTGNQMLRKALDISHITNNLFFKCRCIVWLPQGTSVKKWWVEPFPPQSFCAVWASISNPCNWAYSLSSSVNFWFLSSYHFFTITFSLRCNSRELTCLCNLRLWLFGHLLIYEFNLQTTFPSNRSIKVGSRSKVKQIIIIIKMPK